MASLRSPLRYRSTCLPAELHPGAHPGTQHSKQSEYSDEAWQVSLGLGPHMHQGLACVSCVWRNLKTDAARSSHHRQGEERWGDGLSLEWGKQAQSPHRLLDNTKVNWAWAFGWDLAPKGYLPEWGDDRCKMLLGVFCAQKQLGEEIPRVHKYVMRATQARGLCRTSIWGACHNKASRVSTTAFPLRPSPLGPVQRNQEQQREGKETASKAVNSPTQLHPSGQPEGKGGAGLWLTAMVGILNQSGLNTWKLYVVIKIKPLLYLKRTVSARSVCGICFRWRGKGECTEPAERQARRGMSLSFLGICIHSVDWICFKQG